MAVADGTAWIIVGTDSGYGELTMLYYERVEAVFIRKGGSSPRRSAQATSTSTTLAWVRSGSHW